MFWNTIGPWRRDLKASNLHFSSESIADSGKYPSANLTSTQEGQDPAWRLHWQRGYPNIRSHPETKTNLSSCALQPDQTALGSIKANEAFCSHCFLAMIFF